MPTILTGILADLAATNVPRLSGIIRYGLREIPSSQFLGWSLQEVMHKLGLSIPLQASKIVEYSLGGVLSGDALWKGLADYFAIATSAPLAVRSSGIGGGRTSFMYRVVYDFVTPDEVAGRTNSLVVVSQTPLDLPDLESSIEDTLEIDRKKGKRDTLPGTGSIDIGLTGIDFITQIVI